MRKIWSFLLVAILGLSLVLTACGDTPTPAGGTTQGATTQAAQAPAIPTGVKSAMAGNFPDSTVLYITLNTDMNSGQIKGWQKIIEYVSQIPEVKNITQNIDVLALAQLGTYDGDIKPWIGSELAIGVTDLSSLAGLASGSGNMPSELPVLIGAPVTDRAKAEAFITKLGGSLQKMGMPAPTTETYKDATLYTINVQFFNVVVGLGKDKLFIGGGPALVKGAFDQATDKSLANAANYKTVSGKLPTGNLSFAYFDFQAVVKSISSIPEAKASLDSLKGTNFDYTGPLGVTFGIADEGFRIDSYSVYLPDKTPAAIAAMLKKGANPNKALTVIPENAMFFGNSQDASSMYDMVLSAIKSSSSTAGTGMSAADVDKGIADFEKETGLSVRNDIVSLFSGEFAFFVNPSNTPKDFPVALAIIAEATDKAGTQAKLDKITAAIEKAANGKAKFESKTVGSTAFKSMPVTDSGSKSTLNLGIAGNYAFMSIGDDATTGLITAATGGKNFTNGANAANFNKVRDALPKENVGYFYLDIQSVIKYALQLAPTDMQAQAKAYTDKLDKLYSIGATTRQNPNESASTLFIYFPVTK